MTTRDRVRVILAIAAAIGCVYSTYAFLYFAWVTATPTPYPDVARRNFYIWIAIAAGCLVALVWNTGHLLARLLQSRSQPRGFEVRPKTDEEDFSGPKAGSGAL